MRRTSRRDQGTRVTPLLVLSLVLFASAQEIPPIGQRGRLPNTPTKTVNGTLWLRMTDDERAGFVDGYEDCYIYDSKGKQTTTGWTSNDYVKAVTAYYTDHQDLAAIAVTVVLQNLDHTGKPRTVPKGGEHWKEAHGYYDGLWWRQSSENEQLGYVQGYLACYRRLLVASPTTFSKPPNAYWSLMNAYITQNPKSDDEKLANILKRYADPSSGGTQDHKQGRR